MKHTKGPWKIGVKQPKPIIYGPSGEQIADLRDPMLFEDENQANAHLIAAAPEMLEALEAVDRAWAGDGICMSEAIDLCLTAINKAKGVSK